MRKRASVLMLLLAFPCLLISRETQVSLSATHNLALIGDRVGVTLLVKADQETNDIDVELEVDTKVCEIVAQGMVTKRIVPEGIVLEQKFELAFFDLGDFDIGPAKVRLFARDEKQAELSSNKVPITIKGLVKKETQELVLGKPPRILSGSPFYLLKMVWMPFVAVLLLFSVFIVIKKRRKRIVSPPSLLTDFQIFDGEIAALFSERLFEKGFQMLFFLRLTHILKKFLQRWHSIDAEEMTTEELRGIMRGFLRDSIVFRALMTVLEHADLVKFARHELINEEYSQLCGHLDTFIEGYRLEERDRVLKREGIGENV